MATRAFELVPIIDKCFPNERTRTTVESVECCGSSLYIGTNDSCLLQYCIEEVRQETGKLRLGCIKVRQKNLGLKRPIQTIKAVSALNRLFVVCDNTLFLLNMDDFEFCTTWQKMKGIHCFCLNDNPRNSDPYSVQISISRKRQLIIYNVSNDKAFHLKDISISEIPNSMAMDNKFLCVALATHYAIVDCELGYVQDLFPYDSITTTPFVLKVGKDEFLLNGPGALGMFATTAGISERPPIHWSETLRTATYSHPYVLALDENFISVYSILDQQLKQTLPFQGGYHLYNFDGSLIVSSTNSIYSVHPIPWEIQVQALLSAERTIEALELTKHSNRTGLSAKEYNKVLRRIQQQAGFIEFARCNFDEAREFFRDGCLDVRELICLYPKLLPSNSTFTRSIPLLHHIADVKKLCLENKQQLEAYNIFLISYLEDVREKRIAEDWKLEIDTALLKLYAETNAENLIPFITSKEIHCELTECAECLRQYDHYNALGLFYHRQLCDVDKALAIWIDILNGKFHDATFMGLSYLLAVMTNVDDKNIIWKYADSIFQVDPISSVQIFIGRSAKNIDSEKDMDEVVKYLGHYPKALVKYLEFLVHDKKILEEKYHTCLAVLYMEQIFDLQNAQCDDSEELQSLRKTFRFFLQSSSHYRVQLIFGKIQQHTNLLHELAILHGKMDQHETALKILVHDLNDPEAAREYCTLNSFHENNDQCILFHALLTVYLDGNLSVERQQELFLYAIQLLNSSATEFDVIKVLEMIPTDWSIATLEQFFCKILRSAHHYKRTKQIQHHLHRAISHQIKLKKYDLTREPIIIPEERICAVCSRLISKPEFVHQNVGKIVHHHCNN